jgi:NAD(P)-dependent dehydrogenase (short-subunit alcohol dehydrogenase family)
MPQGDHVFRRLYVSHPRTSRDDYPGGASTLFRLDGKVALVTGASSGLGARFAEVLAEAGARTVLVARRAERLSALAERLGGEPVVIAADLSDPADAERVVQEAVAATGGLDILVNNAGISNVAPAVDESLDDFERVVSLNLVSAFAVARSAAKVMIDGGEGGCIVNVASIMGIVGIGQMPQAAYAASKGGLTNLTRELAAQWARKGVRVNALAPGFFVSEMTEELFASDRGREWVAQRTPMGRPGGRTELDGALLFLCSEGASGYVTGHILAVDGGWTAV